MKAVILAGGLGTRIVEESHLKPKPMIEIGEHPILWHIMKIYACQGVDEFIVCLGYKSNTIKDFFLNYHYYNSDLTIDLVGNTIEVHRKTDDIMKVTLVETGLETATAGRLKRVAPYLKNDETFCLTYGDGLANIDIKKQLNFHRQHGRTATVTAVQPAGRFGLLNMNPDGVVDNFQEKAPGDGGWTNGGFFVFNHEVFEYLPEKSDRFMLENFLMTQLAKSGQLMAYYHRGFWKCMDALRDKHELEQLWNSGSPPWKIWR
ncbi:MAG: glucose-1-phosphate cytidylyltransferase [Candidatus Adiutrix sp.]